MLKPIKRRRFQSVDFFLKPEIIDSQPTSVKICWCSWKREMRSDTSAEVAKGCHWRYLHPCLTLIVRPQKLQVLLPRPVWNAGRPDSRLEDHEQIPQIRRWLVSHFFSHFIPTANAKSTAKITWKFTKNNQPKSFQSGPWRWEGKEERKEENKGE